MTGFLFEDVGCVDDLRKCVSCGEVFDQFGGDKGPWLRLDNKSAQDHCHACWSRVVEVEESQAKNQV